MKNTKVMIGLSVLMTICIYSSANAQPSVSYVGGDSTYAMGRKIYGKNIEIKSKFEAKGGKEVAKKSFFDFFKK